MGLEPLQGEKGGIHKASRGGGEGPILSLVCVACFAPVPGCSVPCGSGHQTFAALGTLPLAAPPKGTLCHRG